MERKLAHWQRKMARQKKGSNRRKKTKERIARIHAGIANRRKHFAHLQSKQIADGYDAACIESHSLKGQAQTRLAKSVHDAGHGHFRQCLAYKMSDRGKQLVEADPYFPSSKTCYQCGFKLNQLSLGTRKWTCPQCGDTHDRDFNAAKMLEQEGRKQLTTDEV
jgi:putative transposase